MYRKLNFNEKIRLFLISLEAINIYQQYNSKFFFTKHYKNSKYINNNNTKNYKQKLTIIYSIYKLVKQQCLQKITENILNSYNNYDSRAKFQYLKRYKYLYEKTHNYYYVKSYCNNLYIEYNAIMNLYIINQTYGIKGLYILIKYLYESY